MFRSVVFAWTILGLTSIPAAAQDIAAPLRDLLSRLPVAALGTPSQPAFVMFGDPVAGSVAMSAPPDGTVALALGPYGPAFRAAVSGFREFDLGLLGQMSNRAGFGFDDVQAIITVENPPQDIVLIRLSPGTAEDVPATLRANGYSETTEMGYPAFARGGDDYSVDIAARDLADPFGNRMGRASRIVLDGDLLMQAPGWPELSLLQDETAVMLADRADMAAILDALNSAAPDGAVLVRAVLLGNQGLFDPYPGDPDGNGVPLNLGLPPWSIGLFADMSDGHTETGGIALSFATEEIALEAAKRLLSGWNTGQFRASGQTYAETAGGLAAVAVYGSGPFVTVLLASAPTTVNNGMPENPSFELLLRAMAMGNLEIIGLLPPSPGPME